MNLTETRPEEGRQIQGAEERLPPGQEGADPADPLLEIIPGTPNTESQITPTAPEICITAGGTGTGISLSGWFTA